MRFDLSNRRCDRCGRRDRRRVECLLFLFLFLLFRMFLLLDPPGDWGTNAIIFR